MGLSINPPYFGYNSAEQEIHVMCILTFQGPFGTQIERGFLCHQDLPEKQNEKKNHVRGPLARPRHLVLFGPRSSDGVHLRSRLIVLT
jgi:hypothetical protein